MIKLIVGLLTFSLNIERYNRQESP